MAIASIRRGWNVIDCRYHKAPGGDGNRALLVMLPGVGIGADEFGERGLVASVHDRGLPIDVVATRPSLDHYLDGTIAAELHRAIVEPALRQGYTRLWFLGVSLGGMGALLYATVHGALVEGVVLLAPFLGTQGTVAELAEAGGLASWPAGASTATASERQMLVWLQRFLSRAPLRPALYLGYGRDDRFAVGHRLLAERLPTARVVTADGGHDWETWATLWRRVLDAEPFAARPTELDAPTNE